MSWCQVDASGSCTFPEPNQEAFCGTNTTCIEGFGSVQQEWDNVRLLLRTFVCWFCRWLLVRGRRLFGRLSLALQAPSWHVCAALSHATLPCAV